MTKPATTDTARSQVAAFLAGMEFGATKPRATRRHVRLIARQRYSCRVAAQAFRQAVQAIRYASEPATV